MRQIDEPLGIAVFAVDTEHMQARADAGYLIVRDTDIDAALGAAGPNAWLKRIAA